MVVWSPPLTGGLHARKKNEICSVQSRDISSLNLGVVNWNQTYSILLIVYKKIFYFWRFPMHLFGRKWLLPEFPVTVSFCEVHKQTTIIKPMLTLARSVACRAIFLWLPIRHVILEPYGQSSDRYMSLIIFPQHTAIAKNWWQFTTCPLSCFHSTQRIAKKHNTELTNPT
jgi:hypothetical protein